MANYAELQDKQVLITGVNSGIGLAQAMAFINQGAIVTGLDRNTEQMEKLKQKFPQKFRFIKVDLTDVETLIRVLSEIKEIDILINTAGILDDYRTIDATSLEQWTNVFNTNVTSMFIVTKTILPILKQGAIIVNTASIAGMVAGGGGIAYTTSKHAVIGFTKQLALDYAEKGIRVNGIAPGCIDTPMNAKDFENDGRIAKNVAKEIPIKRWAGACEVASVTLFLASNGASYLQGTVIPVDGGWIIK